MLEAANGLNRKGKYKSCFTGDKFTPLWDLTNELENEIYKEYGIEIPPIYEKVNRTGCMRMSIWKLETRYRKRTCIIK